MSYLFENKLPIKYNFMKNFLIKNKIYKKNDQEIKRIFKEFIKNQ